MPTDNNDGKPKRGRAKTAKPHLKVVATGSEAESAVTGETQPEKARGRKACRKSAIQANGLTAKQEAFAQAVFDGENFSDAYRQAYDAENMSNASIHRQAHELAYSPKVSARLEQLSREKEHERRMQRVSRADRTLQKLEEIALRPGDPDGTQVRALELLGKTMGLFVDRVETEDKTERDAETIRRDLEERLSRLLG